MNVAKLALTVLVATALAACGKKPAEPARPAAAPATAAAPAPEAPKDGGKAEEHTEAPDTHGMPGMADLFKDKDEKK